MHSVVKAKRIGAGSTFKLLFIGSVVFHIATTLLMMLLTLVGVVPLENAYVGSDISVSPMLVLLAYLVAGLILCPVWVCALWLSIWPGLWLYSLVRYTHIGYVAAAAAAAAEQDP